MEPLLILGGAVLSAPWLWHHRSRPHPPGDPEPDRADAVERLWASHVADQGGPLAGAGLALVRPFEHGVTYRVQLVPGRQSLALAHGRLPLVSTGLRRPLDEIILEQDPDTADPSQLRLQVITRSPIRETVLFDRPRFDDGAILLGPHADGIGDAAWRLYTRNSMWGGFVLGSVGSGKSRLIEAIALTARAMGVTAIVYVDGQDGASSSVLWRHAAMRAGAADSTRTLAVIEQIMHDRQRHNVAHELSGFTAAADRVGILVIVDEAHVPFGQHAERWAHIARAGRKVGLAVLAADQYSDLKVFGGMEPLRSSLLAGNGIALRTASRMAGHLIPGLALDPHDLPTLPGYGYLVAAPGSDARTAPFRARYLPDRDDKADDPTIAVPSVQQWFERIPAVQLDAAAQASMQAALDGLDGRKPVALTKSAASAPEVDEAGRTMADRILALFADHGPRMKLPAIINALPGEPMRTVRHGLKVLVDRGVLTRPEASRGIYELA